jgi:hypothetical protein
MHRYLIALAVCIVLVACGEKCRASESPLAEKYLLSGQLAEGQRALDAELQKNGSDDQARFGLGVVQFLRAVEHLAQSLHRYGLRSDRGQQMGIPFLRLPVPANEHPEKLTYAASRKILEELIADLQSADTTLSGVKSADVKLPLHLVGVRFDLDGNGAPEEPLVTVLSRYMGGRDGIRPAEDLLITFDRADVAWLRGYSNLLMAFAEVALAHDGQQLFDHTAHLFFSNVEAVYPFLEDEENNLPWNIVDLVALIHLLRLPVCEPERMKTALAHLEQMIVLSRESWKFILAETDDDHEWIPNPKQHAVIGVGVPQEMVDGWLGFLDEAEKLLNGKSLIPFWRGHETRGINIKRVFTEPREFDLVLWVQGTAAVPYLEAGSVTDKRVWERLQRVFRGEFIGFALWFN